MRAKRIHVGFHRLGLALAVACGVPGVGLVLLWSFAEMQPITLTMGVGFLLFAGVLYTVARVVAWIIVGFLGEGST